MKKTKNFFNVPDWVLIDAVRYAVGRRSYQVSVTAEWVISNWKNFSLHVQGVMRHDLQEAIAMDYRMRAMDGNHRWLGDDIDRQAWLSVFEVMNGQ